MILAAALLVLLGLALFVGGVVTDIPVLYWLCVAACVVAGAFLVLARVRMAQDSAARADRPGDADRTAPPTQQLPATPGPATGAAAAGLTSSIDEPAAVPPAPAEPVPAAEPVGPAAPEPPSTGEHARRGAAAREHDTSGDPPVEEVEVTDLLIVVDLRDEVVVVDEHPRYHLPGCRWLAGRETIPLPLDEARTDGFTPCGWCEPDRTLAERERGRR